LIVPNDPNGRRTLNGNRRVTRLSIRSVLINTQTARYQYTDSPHRTNRSRPECHQNGYARSIIRNKS
jgi:hypothetical protein